MALNAQLGRVHRQESQLFKQLTAAHDERRTTELFDRIHSIKDTGKALSKQIEDEQATFAQKLLRAQVQVKALPTAQRVAPAHTPALTPPVDDRSSAHQIDVVDLTDDEPASVAELKRERSSSFRGDALSTNEVHKRQRATGAAGSTPQPRVKREYSPPIVDEGAYVPRHERQHASLAPNAAQERERKSARASTNKTKYAPIAASHPTVVALPNQAGAVELRCDMCGGNAHPTNGAFTKGAYAFLAHFIMCHRGALAANERFSLESVVERCIVHRLTRQEVEAVRAGDGDAYRVKAIAGASRDDAPARPGGPTQVATFGANPYGRSAEEEGEDG
ncbi:hypothetical protein LTR08_007256 [Meristemomyces frigidus]|nr:hypothetical protein LTR08_007256 [Meristemomyces frigidus]